METINSFKGYGKVSEAEDREFRRKTRRRLILIIIGLVLLLFIAVGVTVGTIISRKRNDNGTDSPSPSSGLSTASSIKAMCKVTRYPDSCFSSLSSAVSSSSSKSDPEELFKLSIHVAMNAVAKLSSVPDSFSVPANDKRLRSALDVCKELYEDAVDQLNTSLSSLSPAPGENLLTSSKLDDLKTWLSAAITDLSTCLDGFEGTVGDAGDKMKVAMNTSTELTSNALAITAGIVNIMNSLKFPIHRKLLTETKMMITHNGLPHWVSPEQRRELQGTKGQVWQPNVTVAKDGSGDVMTVGEAVAMVPKKNKDQFVIYVKAGEYVENVIVDKSKWNVYIYGDGIDKTVISGGKNFIDGTPTFSTATFVAVGRRFMAKGIAFKNTAGPDKHQAVALRAGSDQSVFYKCSFDGYQDTLYAHSLRQFYRECDITGTIDFIFGNAAVVFQSCNIKPRQPLPNQSNTITAQGRTDPNQNTGISVQSSTISALDSLTRPTYLGRPWKPYSTTIIMKTEISAVVDPAGWLPWVAGTVPPETIMYGEYANTGPGAAVTTRVKWPGYQSSVSDKVAQKYSVASFIAGDEWLPNSGVEFVSTLS
ncbi:putative pectinesterase [Dioscorea sansibarensis]